MNAFLNSNLEVQLNNTNHRFMELLEPVYERLERFALSMTRNRDDAKDVVGETILNALAQFDSLRNEQAFLSFLFTIASRVFYRELRRRDKYQIVGTQDIDELFGDRLSPEDQSDLNLLFEAAESLPVKHREALFLYYLTGFSQKEIAEIQKTTATNVKLRIFRARRKLRNDLKLNNIPNKPAAHAEKDFTVEQLTPERSRL
ncbi:MAG: RNA polymerase sigma factor [Chlorobi bacterium]|nr:RNA polymerase sigma factor [Chlorobiota bacterium]